MLGSAMYLHSSLAFILVFKKTGFLSYYSIGAFILFVLAFFISMYAAWFFLDEKKVPAES